MTREEQIERVTAMLHSGGPYRQVATKIVDALAQPDEVTDAEAAAKDFASLLRRLDEWDVMRVDALHSDAPYWRECIARTFARHPEFAPDAGDRRWKPGDTPTPMFVRAADRLYRECERAIRAGRLDARNPIADAALDYQAVRDEMSRASRHAERTA